jgi:tellurite resistance protein
MDQVVPGQLTRQYLDYLPVALFGSVMGMTGLSVAWQLAHVQYGAPLWIAQSLAVVSAVTFVALSFAYAVKLWSAADAVKAEFLHPIAGNLFGTILISLLLLPIVIAPVELRLAQILWVLGAVGMLLFAWRTVGRWMSERQQPAHATPAWVIPVVGLLDVPLAIPYLAFPALPELMIFSLAVGLFFAIPIFTLIFSRLVFEAPMPDALQPTLLILAAPFSVGFSAYVTITGHVDLFAQALYSVMLFLLAVLFGRLKNALQCCPFRVAWWAVSFPLAASAIAAIRFATATPGLAFRIIAWVLLLLATVTILGLLARTLVGIARGELKTLST